MVYIPTNVPIRNAIYKFFVRNGYSIIFLPFFHFYKNLIVLSEICDLLHTLSLTFESMNPCFIPSLFIATKFFSGYLILETLCSCHPDTTMLIEFYTFTSPVLIFLGGFAVSMGVTGEVMKSFFNFA